MSFWYDVNRTLSYNALFSFILGARGLGKTYGFKDWSIRDFINNQNQFMYIRRYDTEFKHLSKFWNDIQHDYPEHELQVKGEQFLIDGADAGQAIPLSTSKNEKSVPYPRINKMIYDEFIIDQRNTYHYLYDEVTVFLELFETVARLRENVRAFFLSNAISQINPYFLYFDLKLPRGKNISYKNNILLELCEANEFIESKKNTRFGKMISGTKYGDYAIDNVFLRDTDTFIEKRSTICRYYFTIHYQGLNLGVWVDWKIGKLFVSYAVDPSCPYNYTLSQEDHTPNTLLVKRLSGNPHFKTFIEAYKQGCLRFEDMKIKGLASEIIKLTLI